MRERIIWRRGRIAFVAALLACAIGVTVADRALAEFPYPGGTTNYEDLFLPPGQVPSDVGGDDWKYAATPEASPPLDPFGVELGGVRGAHIVDPDTTPPTAWETTTGRPDVQIAVLDSGIEWNNQGAMANERLKVWLNKGELPTPNVGRNDDGSNSESLLGEDCAGYTAGQYDANGDGVFNLKDYACDDRVNVTDERRVGPAGFLTPQDLILAFSNSDDADGNGFVDDIAGWDFSTTTTTPSTTSSTGTAPARPRTRPRRRRTDRATSAHAPTAW